MSEARMSDATTPFESGTELREVHACLLEALDTELGQDTSAEAEQAALARLEPKIRQFLSRGSATGVYLEDIKERTDCQMLLDFWASSLSQSGTHTLASRLANFDGTQLPDLNDKPHPYVGLNAFQDPTFFFGREADIEALVAQLRETPLVVVVGASGSGKSSLVMGGVLPALEAKAPVHSVDIVAPFVPGNAVLDHLAEAVLKRHSCGKRDVAAEVVALRENPDHLYAMLERLGSQAALITIDQFEEVFTLSGPADREALIANLVRVLAAARGHRVILTVREEFRTRIVELRALSPYLDKAWFSMRPMDYEQLRAAVERPAALVNLQFQSGIVDDLVKKVLGQPAALPLLQFTLRSLWEKRDRNRITWEVYRRVGDPLNSLRTSADRFYDGLAPQTQDEVKRVLLELVRVDDLLEAYRQPVLKYRLLQAGKANTEDVLGLLTKNDYIGITSESSDTDAVVEIKHESLVRNWPRLVTWIDEKRHQRRQRLALTQAAKRWDDSGRPPEGLLTGWQLQMAELQPDLSDLEKDFVACSAEAIDRLQREKEAALRREAEEAKLLAEEKSVTAKRLRLLWMGTIICALIAIFAIWNALSQANQSRLKRERDLLAMKAPDYVDSQLDLALLLAVEVNRMPQDDPEPLRSLLSVLTTNLEVNSFLRGHAHEVTAVTFSPNSRTLASASDEGIILWDIDTRRMIHPPLTEHKGSIHKLAFSSDGMTLASAGADGAIGLWNVKSGQLVDSLRHPSGEVWSVAMAKGENLLASGGEDGTVRLWNLESRALEKIFTHSTTSTGKVTGAVRQVAFSAEGSLLASGGWDGHIILWDIKHRRQAGEPLKAYAAGTDGQTGPVWSMAFSHNGRIIASADSHGGIDLWDVRTRKKIKSRKDHLEVVSDLAFSPDDTQLATVSHDRNVYMYNVESFDAGPRRLHGYAERFLSVDFSEDGKLATGTANGNVVLWDPREHHRFGRILQAQTENPTSVLFAAGGTFVSHSNDKLMFWSLVKREWTKRSADAGQQIAFSVSAPNGQVLATIGTDNSIKLWDAMTRRPIATLLQPGKEKVESAAFSTDNSTLAVGVLNTENYGEIRLLNLTDGTVRHVLQSPQLQKGEGIWAVAFSPNRKHLASVPIGFGIDMWELDTSGAIPKPLKIRPLWDVNVNSLAFSPDGKVLAAGGNDGVIWLWNTETQSVANRLDFHRDPVLSVAFSPDGKRLASGSQDTVLLWDVGTGQRLSPPLRAHSAAVTSVAFDSDGQWLASSGSNGSVIVWNFSISTWLSRACQVTGRNLTKAEWKQFFGHDDKEPPITCAGAVVDAADVQALIGNHRQAERLFDKAFRAALQNEDPEVNNSLCWYGSIHEFGAMVKPACERAVKLAPAEFTYWDSRGLARALTGDTKGAIEDFTAVVDYLKALPDGGFDSQLLHRREIWISALKEGRNPFSRESLKALRIE